MSTLSLYDISRLEAADGWLEQGHYAKCWDELESIDYKGRGDERELAIRWKLYNQTKQHVSAANLAEGIQWRFPDKVSGYVWRSISLHKLGCTEDAYDNLKRVAGKFDGLGIVSYLLAVYSCQLQRMDEARDWLEKAFATPDSKE